MHDPHVLSGRADGLWPDFEEVLIGEMGSVCVLSTWGDPGSWWSDFMHPDQFAEEIP